MIYIATNNLNDGFPLSDAYDDAIYQKANSEYYLKFRFPVDRFGVWKNLTCETVLKADDARGVQLFRIKKVNKINGYIRVYAKHITDDINFIEVNQLNVTNATGKRVMTALAGSIVGESRFVFDSDIATMHTLNLSDTTAGDILSKDKRSIIGQWGGELVRNNFLINLKARGGVDTEILFMNKKNVKNQDNSISTENLITRLKLSVEVEKENNEKEVIKATVESPYINTYPQVYTGYLKVTDKNVTDREKLIEYGNRYFRNTLVDFPKDNLTVNVIDKNQERINLFDTVWFRNVEYGIDKRLKVVAYEYSPMSKRYIKISFGALKINSLSQIKNLNQLEERIDEKIEESKVDAFKIQKNLKELMRLEKTDIMFKMKDLEAQAQAGVEVKKALFEKDGTVPPVTRTKILDAVEADIARLKTIITEAELIKAIQAHLNYAEIKTALIDKAFITQILSDETFRQQFEAGEVTTQNIFTKMRDSIQSSIKKEFLTKDETKKLVNDLTIGADGIRQITQEETNKIFELRKPELKGKDGKIPAFNQLIGTRFPSLDVVKPVGTTQLKLNKKDYNNQNSIEVLPNASNELQGFSLKANFRDIAPGKYRIMRIPVYIFSDSGNNTEIKLGLPINGIYDLLFSIPLTEVQKGGNKWFVVEKEIPVDNNEQVEDFIKLEMAFISKGDAHFKIAEPYIAVSDIKTDKWLPAIEDMQSYSLTASARIEGSYLNENLSNCKAYLDVYNNGEIVRASTTETPLKIEIKKLVASGYTATGEVTLDSNGLVQNINIPNGKKDGQPIEVVFEVTCGENKTVASARLNNTIDKQLLTETISKVKTFESTIDKFESKIGEINNKKFKMAYNIENICSESGVEKKGNDLYFNTKTPLIKDKEYYVLADLEDVPDNQKVGIFGTKIANHIFATNGLNVWRATYAGDQTKINIYPLGTNTKVKNVEIYEVPEFEAERIDIINYSQGNYNGNSLSIYAKGKLEISKIYTLEFEVVNAPPQGSFISMYENTKTKSYFKKKSLVKGINKLTFRNNSEYNAFGCTIKENLQIRNVKFYKEDFNVGYKNEYNISEMESKINQTKSEIDLSVKKDKVINSINLSGEGVKINADKVDISGTLSAYTGDIGGFKIGYNPNDGGYWLTGRHNFECGMNPGHNVGSRGVQLWAAWGSNWTKPSDYAWSVNALGEMTCRGKAYFGSEALFNYRPTFNDGVLVKGDVQVTGNIFYSNGSDSGYWMYSSHYKSILPSSDGRYVYFNYSGGGNDWIPLNKEISDRRFKRDIQPSTVNGLEAINNLKTYSYTKEYDGKTEDVECGIMAQDVKEYAKSAFQEAPEDVQTYSTFKLVPYLIKAVQELSEKVENLERQLKERSKKDGI